MEETSNSGRTLFASWGYWAFWGVCTALLITLSDRYGTHHFESPHRILFRFALFVGVGVLLGPVMSRPLTQLSRVRFALLAGFILVIAYILWRLATGR